MRRIKSRSILTIGGFFVFNFLLSQAVFGSVPAQQTVKNVGVTTSGAFFQSLGNGLTGTLTKITLNLKLLDDSLPSYANNLYLRILRFDSAGNFKEYIGTYGFSIPSSDIGIQKDFSFELPTPLVLDPYNYYGLQVNYCGNPTVGYQSFVIYGSGVPGDYPDGEAFFYTSYPNKGYDDNLKDLYFVLENIIIVTPPSPTDVLYIQSDYRGCPSIPMGTTYPISSLIPFTPDVTGYLITANGYYGGGESANGYWILYDETGTQILDYTDTGCMQTRNWHNHYLVHHGVNYYLTVHNIEGGNGNNLGIASNLAGNLLAVQLVGTLAQIVKEPIVIVPGIMGSWMKKVLPNLWVGEWELDPIQHTYDDLCSALTKNGYVPGQTLFTFPYDWRFDNRLTAVALRDKISEIKSISNCQKVNVIAHSMGGLVARYYIESNLYQNDIDQLILLGTPNEGAPRSYLMWEGGENSPPSGISDAIEALLKIISRAEGFNSDFKYVRNKPVVSVKQLLPVYDYLRSATTGRLLTYSSGYPENVFLSNSDADLGLNSPAGLAKLEQSGVNIVNISGDNLKDNTIEYIRIVNDQSFLPLWEHGCPEGFDSLFGDHGLELGSGDGTVPLVSAQSLNLYNVEQIVINADHLELPTAAFDKLFKAITGESAAVPILPISLVKNLLIIPVFSPVDIQVIDPSGRRIGKDFSTNQDINEIPLAHYTGFENPEMEFVTIPNPIDGKYTIEAQGTGTGSYKVESTFISDNTSTTATFTANTQPGLMEETSFDFSSSTPNQSVITPADTTPPSTDISLVGTSGNNNWFISDVQVTLSAQDSQEGVGVFKTEYSLDNGSTWNTYIKSFSISKEGISSILYRSQDFVGNIEQAQSREIKIDKTPPEAKIYFDKDNQTLKIEGLDNLTSNLKITLSTVNASFDNNELKNIDDDIKTECDEAGMQPLHSMCMDKKKIVYQIQDDAGHTLKLTFKRILDKNHLVYAFLSNLQYDKNPMISLPKTTLNYFWFTNRHDNYNYLFQRLLIQNQVSINTKYIQAQNKTVISIKEKGEKKQEQTLPGLVITKLTTKSGSLGYEF